MNVLVTGATGFVGRALVPVLQRHGHQVFVWARSPRRARARLGAEIHVIETSAGPEALVAALERCDAVINLAGEPILGGRWTAARKRALAASRVDLTRELVQAIGATTARPRVLVSGSAVGWYGDRGDEVLAESAAAGRGWLADLSRLWEHEAGRAAAHGVRVVTLRTGVVLGSDGGALAQMRPAFTLGLGGPIGTGRQYLPWIHLHDLVAIIVAALTDDRYRGPINGTAPTPVTSRDFARALGRALHRPAVLPTPAVALRLVFGEAAQVLLDSQRVVPAALEALGFRFVFPVLDAALADVCAEPSVTVEPLRDPVDPHGSVSGTAYLATRRPVYELRSTTVVAAPLARTFEFFSKAENLGLLTPSAMHFTIDGVPPVIAEDTTITYRLRVGPFPLSWRTLIVTWRPGERFVDLQQQGPYRSWWHEHTFRADGQHTVMTDRVCYAPPFGLLGRLVNPVVIEPTLRRIFHYRGEVIRLRFGAGPVDGSVRP